MDLLDWLSWRVLCPAADGVVEDMNLLDARVRLLQQILNFLVIALPHNGIVCKELLLRWAVVDCEARLVCREVLLLPADVVDRSLVVLLLVGHAGTVDFGPWLSSVRTGIDVLEGAGRHVGLLYALDRRLSRGSYARSRKGLCESRSS